MQFYKEHAFLVDMGRWRKVASIEKAIKNEVGFNWHVNKVEPLDRRGRRFLVKAKYVEPETRIEMASYALAKQVEEKPKPVMGQDVFSKTQMRKVQAMLDEEHKANRTLAEELSQSKDENKALLAELEKARSAKPQVKKVKAPSFAKEKKAEESEFVMLRNCVLSKLSVLERFDSQNVRHCAESCGLKERGLEGTPFVRSFVASLVKLGYIELAGYRNQQKTYKLTQKGLGYLEEVRKDEHN